MRVWRCCRISSHSLERTPGWIGGLGCTGILRGSLRNISWNGSRRKVLSWRTHEGCEPTGASKAGLDFWQRFKEGSCRSGRSSMVWVCLRVGWRRLLLQGIFSLSGDKRCCVRSEGGVESKTSLFSETLSDEVGFGRLEKSALWTSREV